MSVPVAILGPGGVGGFLAAALDRAGAPLVLVAREETATALAADGLQVTSTALDATWHARPTVVPVLEEDVEVLVVATKALGLTEALDRVTGEVGVVVPLLNGLEHMDLLRARYGADRVIAAAIRIQSDRPTTGVIEQSSAAARIDLADAGVDPARAAELLAPSGVELRVGGSEADVLWGKLARLNAIASTTTAFERTLGEIREDPALAAQLRAVVEETVAVARAEGVTAIDAEVSYGELLGLLPSQSSSLARDVAAGRPSELDAICGAVLRAGARHGLDCPTITRLRDVIAAREAA